MPSTRTFLSKSSVWHSLEQLGSCALPAHILEPSFGVPARMLLPGSRVAAIVAQVRAEHPLPLSTTSVICQGEPSQASVFALLIEDKTPSLQNTYAEFIQSMHGLPHHGLPLTSSTCTAAEAASVKKTWRPSQFLLKHAGGLPQSGPENPHSTGPREYH